MSDDKIDHALEGVEPTRRDALRTMITKTAFVAPIVATFAMSGLSIHEAHAYATNLL